VNFNIELVLQLCNIYWVIIYLNVEIYNNSYLIMRKKIDKTMTMSFILFNNVYTVYGNITTNTVITLKKKQLSKLLITI